MKVQFRELRSQTIVEQAIQEVQNKIQSPFTEEILAEPKPDRFQVPQMRPYDGKSDAVAFLHQFRRVVILETS